MNSNTWKYFDGLKYMWLLICSFKYCLATYSLTYIIWRKTEFNFNFLFARMIPLKQVITIGDWNFREIFVEVSGRTCYAEENKF